MNTPLTSIRLIGMVHLLPLPGAPGYGGSRQNIIDRALHDTANLEQAGFDAVLIENYGDVPFAKTDAGKHVTADMTAIISAIKQETDMPFGLQVLRNDVESGLSIAAATHATFLRINVHTGAMHTDQGIIEGTAHDTLRLRRCIDAMSVHLLADVFVKHAAPLAPASISESVRDTVERELADGIIISGSGTGEAADLAEVQSASEATAAPVYVGSGVRLETLAETLALAHGVIVGTAIKTGRITAAPVDREAARTFVQEARSIIG